MPVAAPWARRINCHVSDNPRSHDRLLGFGAVTQPAALTG